MRTGAMTGMFAAASALCGTLAFYYFILTLKVIKKMKHKRGKVNDRARNKK